MNTDRLIRIPGLRAGWNVLSTCNRAVFLSVNPFCDYYYCYQLVNVGEMLFNNKHNQCGWSRSSVDYMFDCIEFVLQEEEGDLFVNYSRHILYGW